MSFNDRCRREYCGNGHVQARILDFFGGTLHGDRPAVFLTIGTETASTHSEARPVEELPSWLERGVEIHRSLWDRESLICHLDIEYVNFDDSRYAFLNEARIFALQEPVMIAAEEVLATYQIRPLKLMTGRGYHLVWRISRTSEACMQLANLGHVSASLKRLYATKHAPTGEHVTAELGAAFAGLGLVMEFIASEIKRRAAPRCEIPVEIGAIETGGGAHGREMISVDITEYADPLCSRVMRAPFSIYLKPDQQRIPMNGVVSDAVAPIVVIPANHLNLAVALVARHDPLVAAELAEGADVVIPDASRAMQLLIKAYRHSPLVWFHAEFYSQEHDAPALWPETYDRTPLDVVPPCARVILEHPNDLLLHPGCAQRIVRVMLSLGWHPRHIAGLIRSKYERDYGWGDQWKDSDPATRADFYARVFSGLILTNVDDLVDFNCASAREEGNCFVKDCLDNLLRFRSSLLDRRKYERLAGRPFNGLFLPEKHL